MPTKLFSILEILSVSMIFLSLAGCGAKKSIEAGSTWEVAETTKLSTLIVGDDTIIKAPVGYGLTMTVDRIKKEAKAGKYSSKIALTLAKL